MKPLLLVVGTLCTALGFVGIFLPLLPTTPFLLLAAACFARSSQRFHGWLLGNRWLGPYISTFRSRGGVPLRVKVKAISVLWLTMGVSAWLTGPRPVVHLALAVCGLSVTLLLVRIPTLRE